MKNNTISYKGYSIETIYTGDSVEYQVTQNNVGRYGSLDLMKNAIDKQEKKFIDEHFIIARV